MGSIVANLETDSRAAVRFYNQRGTVEQWIKEGKQAVRMTRLSCHRFRSSEVRLGLSLMAHNLGNLWRRLFGVMLRRFEELPVPAGREAKIEIPFDTEPPVLAGD